MDDQDEKVFKVFEVLSWATPVMVALVGVVVFTFTTFQTKSDASSSEALINARQDRVGTYLRESFGRIDGKLEKLNDKIDAVLLNQKKSNR